MRKAFEHSMYELMGQNSRVLALVADSSTGEYEKIEKEYPDRFFNFGIAEANMVAAGCALAKEGWIPILYALNNFLVYRAYEFIRNDACLQKRNIKFVGLGCGVIANTLGPTHHTTEDISCLRVLPNMTLLSPASAKEVPPILNAAVELDGPVYIRLGKAFEKEVYSDIPSFEVGRSKTFLEGYDVSIFTTGSVIGDAIDSAKRLVSEGKTVDVINFSTIKPLDKEAIRRSAAKTRKVITVEEHQIDGGFGSAVSEALCGKIELDAFERIGFKDTFCEDYGWHQDLKRMYGIDAESIYEVACKILE